MTITETRLPALAEKISMIGGLLAEQTREYWQAIGDAGDAGDAARELTAYADMTDAAMVAASDPGFCHEVETDPVAGMFEDQMSELGPEPWLSRVSALAWRRACRAA